MFRKRARDLDSSQVVSQCLFCRYCKKGRYGEDYFCRAKGVRVGFGSKVVDCVSFEGGDVVERYWRGRRV